MSVIRKVQSKIPLKVLAKADKSSPSKIPGNITKDVPEKKASEIGKKDEGVKQEGYFKKTCSFCKNKSKPVYWDAALLRKFLNDRGRIYPRGRLGTCAKHQRRISCEIKRARHLALLPFTVRAY